MKMEDQMKLAIFGEENSENVMALYDSIMENVRSKHLENDLVNSFMIEYISLLLKFDKKRVLNELKSGKYPFLECLEVCQKVKHELAIAYLKDRLGYTHESIEIYKKR